MDTEHYTLTELILAGCFCLFALIGIITNFALLLIYKKKDLSTRFNCLMLLLASLDMVTMFMYLLTLVLAGTIGPDKLDVLLYFDSGFISCSVYTITAIAFERYLVLCRQVNTDQYSKGWTITCLILLAFLLKLPYQMWNQTNFYYFSFALCWEFLVTALIPCILVLYLNIALYKQLKVLRASDEFNELTNKALRKSILRARLSLSITFIFVISQLLTWSEPE